jgi:hypothetical protein
MRKITKKADFNFVWLFAIVAGSAILLLAIYGAIRFGTTTSRIQSTELAKAISVVTDSMQTGFAGGRKSVINLPKETILQTDCVADSSFGYNTITALIKERPNKDFERFGERIRVDGKYLFVSNESGKNFYVFSVPFEMAFKVADMVIIDSREYCFIGLDDDSDIRNTLSIIGDKAIFGINNCTDDSIRVCFGPSENCDITVSSNDRFETGSVSNILGQQVDYVGNLIYPAIFSEENLYECNVKRLMYRQYVLSNLYLNKIGLMSGGMRNCGDSLSGELGSLISLSDSLSGNMDYNSLKSLYNSAKNLKEDEYRRVSCRLWSQ